MSIVLMAKIVMLGGFGLIIIGLNSVCLLQALKKKETPLFIPLVGGLLLARALYLSPTQSFWWVALLIDWTVPYMCYTPIGILYYYIKQKK